jgi:hypothetical protein
VADAEEARAMNVSDRWQRAALYSLMTAGGVGIIGLLLTVSPVLRPGYFRIVVVVFFATCVVLVALTAAWYWALRLLGR